MFTSDFNYNLPQELIAQHPVRPRDHSRLMMVDRGKQIIEHKHFFDIINYLQAGDLLVWNNSKVFKARLFGKLVDDKNEELFEHKKPVEIFLVREMENEGVWKVLAKPGRHLREGMRVVFAPSTGSGQAPDFYCDAMVKEKDGTILVQFPDNAETVRKKANQYGHIPVPPYVHPVKLSSRTSDSAGGRFNRVKDDPAWEEQYQTIYAKHEGSVAAPTAGFHFTPELIEKLKQKQVEFAEVTLHVGLGTFLPVKSERVEDHTMHSEWVELSEENAEKINRAKAEGRRVIAVGTTTVRTLEGIAQFQISDYILQNNGNETIGQWNNKHKDQKIGRSKDYVVHPYRGDINIFITPGFKFKIVDAMITNFHLPKSTLLMLVSAFVGDTQFMLECYQKAVEEKYRFYSFGDAMLIT